MGKITYTPPPDKSITIRALILSAISNEKTKIENPLLSNDTYDTIKTLKKLGAKIRIKQDKIFIKGFGKYGAQKTKIDVGESALLLRLILPILVCQKYRYLISGKKTILRRSFRDTISILKKMGAKIKHNKYHLPIKTYPSILKPTETNLTSAQTKSSLLIASLYTGKVIINDILKTRDHTERLMLYLGIKIKKNENKIYCYGGKILSKNIKVPNDISQAAVFITIAFLSKKEITIKNCGINQTRTGFLKSLKKMGAKIQFKNIKEINNEPISDIIIIPPQIIKPISIQNISSQIDEIMLLSIIAAKANGITKIHNVKLLKNKESDRLKEIVFILKKLGVNVKTKHDTLMIKGKTEFKEVEQLDTKGDHRVAMLCGVIKKLINPKIKITNPECVKKTYPNFWKELAKIR